MLSSTLIVPNSLVVWYVRAMPARAIVQAGARASFRLPSRTPPLSGR
jgi:hypothetical protein